METPSAGLKQKQVMKGLPLGTKWKKVVEGILIKGGAKQARMQMKTGAQATSGGVVVRIPITFFVRFPLKGKGSARTGLWTALAKEAAPVALTVSATGLVIFRHAVT